MQMLFFISSVHCYIFLCLVFKPDLNIYNLRQDLKFQEITLGTKKYSIFFNWKNMSFFLVFVAYRLEYLNFE